MFFKFIWGIRGLLYKPFLGKFGLPSYLGKPIYISGFKKIFIGERVRIYPGARIEVLGNNASITFEENISVGQNLHITSGTHLVIGKNTTIAENVFISSIGHQYEKIDTHIMDQPNIILETKIGENCFIGYGAVIQVGTVLGKHCVVGSNSVVKGEFDDYSVIAGVPARVIKKYNPISSKWQKVDTQGDFID